MRGPFALPRNVRLVVASAAGITFLVTGALGWLGWRLLSQEHAIEQQRRRDRLEQAADGLVAGLLRALTEAEIRLAQVGSAPPWNLPDPPLGGAAVLFRPTGVEIRPPGALAYVPVLPAASPIDELPFQEAEKLEFRDKDYPRAESALRTLSMAANPRLRAEALLRLARVQAKSGHPSQALITYGQLRAEDGASSTEVPYALLARFEQCKFLASAARESVDREVADLLTGLDAGRWPLRRDAYLYYVSEARSFRAHPAAAAPPDRKLLLSDAVQTIWEEWESGGRRPLRPARRVSGAGDNRTLMLTNSTPDRIVALIYPQEGIRQLIAASGWEQAVRGGIAGSILDENANLIFGSPRSASSDLRASRMLASAQIPWKLQLTSSGDDANALLFARHDRLYVAALVAIAFIVGVACYAMARGVLREIQAARLQSDFVSAVSHEFRSPLTTLCQLTELLAQGRIHDESRRRTYFEVLQKESGRLNRLVENLLDFGRMEAGRRQYRPEAVDLYELVRDAVREYREEIAGSGYGFELTGAAGIVLRADREALRRVIRNLIENAVKYSPDSQTVWIDASRENGAAVLRVRDAGIGIAPQEQDRIFEKFVRGQAAKDACIQGTGIGLAMVKEIVKAHEGEVLLASELGRGSTFTVRLPLPPAHNGSPR